MTRTQPESPFAIGIAKLLGMSEADQTSLYDLGNPANPRKQRPP